MKKCFENKKQILIGLTALVVIISAFYYFSGINGRFVLLKEKFPSDPMLLKNGELFLPGGIKEDGSIISAQIYSFKNRKFSQTQNNMNFPGIVSFKTLLADGRVLISTNRGLQAELFEPKSRKFILTGSLTPEIKFAYGCCLSPVLLKDGRVFIISSGLPEIYNPNTGNFTVAGNIKQYDVEVFGQNRHVRYSTLSKFSNSIPVLLKDGKVLLVGNSYDGNNAEIFDPKTNSFLPTGQMKYSRSQFTATLLDDGRVLVVGGVNNKNSLGIAQVEIFDPKTNSFTVTDSLKVPRYNHSAILLSNGKILVVGGNYAHSDFLKYLKDVELFDPKTEKFIKINSLHKARVYPDLINISKNQVLIPSDEQSEIYKY